MKAGNRPIRVSKNRAPGNEQVRVEIRNFLKALDSYPQRFAEDRRVSFEEHRSSLVNNGESRRRRRD